jgi:hypothetical protein
MSSAIIVGKCEKFGNPDGREGGPDGGGAFVGTGASICTICVATLGAAFCAVDTGPVGGAGNGNGPDGGILCACGGCTIGCGGGVVCARGDAFATGPAGAVDWRSATVGAGPVG